MLSYIALNYSFLPGRDSSRLLCVRDAGPVSRLVVAPLRLLPSHQLQISELSPFLLRMMKSGHTEYGGQNISVHLSQHLSHLDKAKIQGRNVRRDILPIMLHPLDRRCPSLHREMFLGPFLHLLYLHPPELLVQHVFSPGGRHRHGGCS